MPRVRSGTAAIAAHQQHQPQLTASEAVAAGLGGLGLEDAAGGPSAAEAAADAFAEAPLYRAYGHDARIFDLAFHPASSHLLVSASDDCSAGLWRRIDGPSSSGRTGSGSGAGSGGTGGGGGRYMQVAAFRGHGDSVMRAAWAPDGCLVASGSSDGVVCLWRPTEAALEARHNLGAAGTQQLGTLEGHPEEVYACIFLQQQQQSSSSGSGDESSGGGGSSSSAAAGQRLVTASGESLFLWDLHTQRLLHRAQPPPPPAAPPGGSTHQVPERWQPGYLFGVAAQPDGPLLGAACSDGRLRLWAREGGDSALSPLCTLPWNQAMGSDCAFGRNGLFCAVSKDGSVIMMDMRRGTCLQHLQLDAPLLSCTLLDSSSLSSGGSGQCLVAAGADGAVHFVDVATGDVASLFPEAAPERPLLCATLSANATALAVSGESVPLGELDLPGSELPAAGGAPGHRPVRKWSPITVWQRQPAAAT